MAGRDPDQALLEALRHPLRRALLRRCLQSERALGPRELARLEGQSLSGTTYHVRVLLECGAIEVAGDRQGSGALEHFYRPTDRVKKTSWVLASLGLEG